MPLVLRQHTDGGELLLWRIDESEEALCRLVTAEDAASAARFASPKRRLEHLAWRAALRCAVPGAEVRYSRTGAPYLTGDEQFIGVSHTDGFAAVVLSNKRCAVDIEHADRDFGRSAPRFVSQQERGLPFATDNRFEAAVWCAKECAYKYSGRKELDLLRDIRVLGIDGGKVRVSVAGAAEIDMQSSLYEGLIVIHTT